MPKQRLMELLLLCFLLVISGCGGGDSLPPPRVGVDNEEEAETPPAAARSGGVPKTPSARSGSPKPAARQPAPVAAVDLEPIDFPDELTPEARRQRSIQALNAIAAGLQAHLDARRCLPMQAMIDDYEKPVMSWRVELLPFLGYRELYAKFKREEHWDSPHNKPLLEEIPPVYQSVEKGGHLTSFLLVHGDETIYTKQVLYPRQDAFQDGAERTLYVVEADSEMAVPWTQPTEYVYSKREPRKGLFNLHGDGFFAILGDVSVRRVAPTTNDPQIRAIFTFKGHETDNPEDLLREPSVTPDVDDAAQFARWKEEQTRREAEALAKREARQVAAENSDAQPDKPAVAETSLRAAATPMSADLPVVPTGPALADTESVGNSLPAAPDGAALKVAEGMVRDVYLNAFEEAKTHDERRRFARRLLQDARLVRDDSAGFYIMLRAARDVAASVGDVDTAIEAVEELGASYRVDTFPLRRDAILKAIKVSDKGSRGGPLLKEALAACDLALSRDDFDAARDLYGVATTAAGRNKNDELMMRLADAKNRIDATRAAYRRVSPRLHDLLRDDRDPAANEEIGDYLCVFKNNWQEGLRRLALGTDPELNAIAQRDLESPGDAESQARLADDWWRRGEKTRLELRRHAFQRRAAHWYEIAVANYPEGVAKLRMNQRIEAVNNFPPARLVELADR